jgi:hypothetical protein
LIKILGDENIGEFSFGDDWINECDDTQLVTQGTHVIGDSDRVMVVVMNNMKKTSAKDWAGCEIKFVWQNICLFPS